MSPALAVAATFVWLGMVLAISFLESPLRFRAPGAYVVGEVAKVLALVTTGVLLLTA